MATKQLGIVVVTYNSEEVVGACLDSCLATGAQEIVVVDNASTDNTVAEVQRRPRVLCLVNTTNKGFAGGVNQAVAATSADYILILNPDVVLESDISPLIEAAEQYGAACGLLTDFNGNAQQGFTFRRLPKPATFLFETLGVNRLFPGNPVNRQYRCLDMNVGSEDFVEQPAGAFLMLRRDCWTALGGFDKSFHPIWFEDVDLAKRLAGLGARVRYVPSVTAMHRGGHSASRISWECRQVYWYVSLLRYVAKHHSRATTRIVSLAAMMAALPRMLTGIPRERSLEPVWVCAKVVRLAGRFLLYGGAPPIARPMDRDEPHQYAKTSSNTGS